MEIMYRLLLFVLPALVACSAPLGMTGQSPTEVYLLIGQSNMAGRGSLDRLPPNPRIVVFSTSGWVVAQDPLHHDKSYAGVGPGVSFAQTMLQTNPTVRVGLIPAAVGGTSVKAWQKGGALYTEALREARQAGHITGVLWHQGESDALTPPAEYERLLRRLLLDLQEDLHACIVLGEVYASPINISIHHVADELNFPVVPATGLSVFDEWKHFNTPSQRELGRRYAKAFIADDAALNSSLGRVSP